MTGPASARARLLRQGRQNAEGWMTDTCTISRTTGRTTDPTTGVVNTTTAVIYTGRCRVKTGIMAPDVSVIGEQAERVSHRGWELHVPAGDGTLYRADDTATITASPSNPAMIGKTLRITMVPDGSDQTAKRLTVESIQ